MAITAIAFALMFAGGLCLALIGRPIYGLYVYIATFYLHPPSRWWGESLPDLRWSLIAAAITLVAVFVHSSGDETRVRPKWHSTTVGRILFLYVLWMWIQWPWVYSEFHSIGVILFTKYLVLFYLIYEIIDDKEKLSDFTFAHVMGCAYFGWLVVQAPDLGRLEGVGGPGVNDANTLGMHLGAGLLYAAFLLMSKTGWYRLLVLASIPLILNGVIQTETRGAILGVALGAVVTVYLKPKVIRRAFYGLSALAAVGILVVANDSFIKRMDTLRAGVGAEEEWDSSAQSRVAIAYAQLEMFVDHPLGVGHMGTVTLSRQYIEERWLAKATGDRSSHNTLLSVLVDQGLPGIVLMIYLIFHLISRFRYMKRLDKVGLDKDLGLFRAMLGGALVSIFGAGMFAQNLKAELLYWTLTLIAVLLVLCEQHSKDVAKSGSSS